MGHVGLCFPEIFDNLTCIQLSIGMIISKRIAKEMDILYIPLLHKPILSWLGYRDAGI